MHKFKKLWTVVYRATKQLVCFQIGTRETKRFQKLTSKISYMDAKFFTSGHWHVCSITLSQDISLEKQTYTVERINRLLRRYLARLARKTYCYSKSLQMIKYSLLLFMHSELIEYMKI